MFAQCAECNHHFNIGSDDIVSGACPDCGAAQSFYRLNPTPVQGEMVPFRDGVIDGKDQGGNPLAEGTIMGAGGERPIGKRDNYMGKVANEFDFGDSLPQPTHRFVVTSTGKVHSLPYPSHHEDIANAHGLIYHGFPDGMSMGELRDNGSTDFLTHESGWDPGYLQQALQTHFNRPVTVDPYLQGSTNAQRWQLPQNVNPNPQRELDTLYGPANPRSYGTPWDNEGLVRGGSVMERNLNMDMYPSLWEKESAAPAVEFASGPDQNVNIPHHTAMVTPGPLGIHAGTTKWLRFLDAHVNGIPARQRASEIMARYGVSTSPDFGKPVSVAVHHLAHLPAAVDTIASSAGGSEASPKMKEVGRAIQAGQLPAPPPLNGQTLGPLSLEEAASQGTPLQNQSHMSAIEAVPLAAEGLGAGGAALGVPGAAGLADLGAEGTGAAIDGSEAAMGAAEDGANSIGKGIGGAAKGIWNGAKGLLGKVPGVSSGAVAGPLMAGAIGGAGKELGEDAIGDVVHGGEDLLGIGGGGSSGSSGVPGGEAPLSMGQLSSVYSDYETPSSNPSVGTDHDSPEQVDQHEFNDGDNQNNFYNPNLEDSGASGEDAVRQNGGFASDSPALERMNMISPLAMHYFNHPEEDGMSDPVMRGLHEALENENPSYMDGVHAGHIHHLREALKFHGRQPQGVTAAIHEVYDFGDKTSGAPPMGAPDPSQDPNAMPMPPAPPAPNPMSGGQGPQTPEQIAAVQQFLIKHHREHEVPNVVMDPNNPAYVKILDKIQNQTQISAPSVDPAEMTPPPAQQAPPGAMPMPDPAGGGGGQMQPMASFDPQNDPRFSYRAFKQSADSVAPRCPKCGSGTTGLASADGDCFCHACGNQFKRPIMKDNVTSAVAPRHEDHQDLNPTTAPAADQQSRLDNADQGKPGQIADASGQPLREGEEYEMVNPAYSIPDRVKIIRVKPDGLLVSIQGVFSNDPNTPQQEDPRPIPISRQDIQMQQLTFQPASGDADEMSQEPPSGTPGLEQVPPSGQTTDEVDNSYPTHSSSVQDIEDAPDDDECRKCGSRSITSNMSSPTKIMYSCYDCGGAWEIDDSFEGRQASSDLDWIMNDSDSHDDFFAGYERAKAMQSSTGVSRDIRSMNTDSRSQAIKDTLNRNKTERSSKLAGKKFSPREQRDLIDEKGLARNLGNLDISGTHYESRFDLSGKANGDNVDDAHLIFGLQEKKMSEEKVESELECSICGHDGGPYPECDLCKGNMRFVQSKAYTLTEERQKAAKDPGRYGRTGAVGPKIINLPGSGQAIQ